MKQPNDVVEAGFSGNLRQRICEHGRRFGQRFSRSQASNGDDQ